jgi:hypothetical protein
MDLHRSARSLLELVFNKYSRWTETNSGPNAAQTGKASRVITLAKVRELNLSAAASDGRPLHLSAASGLVCLNSFIYVVADDELHLGVFRSTDNNPGFLVGLFAGELPDSKADRKKQKPDLEALTLLPSFGSYSHGALFALGSGSKHKRRMGALVGLDVQGAISGTPRIIDLSDLYAPLDEHFAALNIEGAIVSGDELRLLQRGNKRHAQNAVVRFPLAAVLDALGTDARVGPMAPSAIDSFDLGNIDGIPFCFTDGAALPNGDMVFTAIAEDTEDTYADGPCAGAAIGIADKDGNLLCLHQLDEPLKIEGVDARVQDDLIKLLVVTDADDARIPAGLFSTSLAIAQP